MVNYRSGTGVERFLVTFAAFAIAMMPPNSAHAGTERWWPAWYQCQGNVKQWEALWHTHPASGWPFKHLRRSTVRPGSDPDFSTYTPHSGSPYFQQWDFCVAPLQLQRWYFMNDCDISTWCWNCAQCRPTFSVYWIPYEVASPCLPP